MYLLAAYVMWNMEPTLIFHDFTLPRRVQKR